MQCTNGGALVHQHLCLQTVQLQAEVFDRILFLFANWTLGEEYDQGSLSPPNADMAIFCRILEQIKFMN